ncbi:Lrp/AsnC family transcriptional regulator [Candidatus Woesearchaeota archaeon]|nr:Lrp/AsnC family transcriptional regulator [Candidatus Woesearchaeota archaeon]
MNKKQIDLLMQLRLDGRQTLTQISKKIHMPVSTIFDRVKTNKNDIVQKYTCLLDFSKIGFNCRAQMVFRIKKDHRAEMQEFLLKHPNVNSAYKINNGYDFLVETIFRGMKEVDEFLEKIDERFKVQEKNVYYIIDDLAREAFMTDPIHAELIGIE